MQAIYKKVINNLSIDNLSLIYYLAILLITFCYRAIIDKNIFSIVVQQMYFKGIAYA